MDYITDQEVWKDIIGYEGVYQVSSFGRVRSVDRIVKGRHGSPKRIKGIVLTQEKMNDGYMRVSLSKGGKIKRFPVHRLVASAFIKNPNNFPVINHKDETKDNNHASNLEWCTQSYNVRYGDGIKKMMSSENYWDTRNNVRIKATNVQTGKTLTFYSLREADRKGFSRRSVGRALERRPSIYKGYKWEYIN